MATSSTKLSPPDPAFIMTGLIKIRNIPILRQSRNLLHKLLTDTASFKYGTIACLEIFGSIGMLCYNNQGFNEDAIDYFNEKHLVFEGSHLLFESWFEVYAATLSPEEHLMVKDQACTVKIYKRRELEESQSSKYKASETQPLSRASTSRAPPASRPDSKLTPPQRPITRQFLAEIPDDFVGDIRVFQDPNFKVNPIVMVRTGPQVQPQPVPQPVPQQSHSEPLQDPQQPQPDPQPVPQQLQSDYNPQPNTQHPQSDNQPQPYNQPQQSQHNPQPNQPNPQPPQPEPQQPQPDPQQPQPDTQPPQPDPLPADHPQQPQPNPQQPQPDPQPADHPQQPQLDPQQLQPEQSSQSPQPSLQTPEPSSQTPEQSLQALLPQTPDLHRLSTPHQQQGLLNQQPQGSPLQLPQPAHYKPQLQRARKSTLAPFKETGMD